MNFQIRAVNVNGGENEGGWMCEWSLYLIFEYCIEKLLSFDSKNRVTFIQIQHQMFKYKKIMKTEY